MQSKSTRERLLGSTTILGAMALLISTPALAQQAMPSTAPAGAPEVSEIVVTGSRIPQPNMTSVSPVQVVTDQEVRLQGRTDVADLMNNLPQNFQNPGTDFSSTSNPLSSPGGVATADLRGLGPQRTLVLVNGRRLGIGDANTGNPNPAPDLNQIPYALVDRVEVLTGGASATYGSDAVAGVVNFIMKHDFQGVQIDGQLGINQHSQHNSAAKDALRTAGYPVPKDDVWDGRTQDLSVIVGANGPDGNSNITAYLTYHKQEPVADIARDFAACQIKVNSANHPFCTGSPNSNQFFVASGSGPGIDNQNGFTVIGNQFLDYGTAPNTGTPGLVFNSNPFEYLLHDDRRYSAGFFAHYDVSKNLSLYSDFSFMDDRTVTQVAPSGLFEGSGVSPNGGFLVNCDNPLLSAQQASTLCSAADIASGANADLVIGRRNVEGGGRMSTYDHKNYRAVIGARGDVPDFDGWKYDVYGSYYYTSLFQSNQNYLSLARIQNALQVVNVNGVPTCKSVIAQTDAGCVPYNIFNQGGVTPAQVAYLNSAGTAQGVVDEAIFQANLTGDLGRYGIKSPWANDGIGVALGLEHRRQTYNFAPDQASLSGDLSGFGGASTTINASLSVDEYYGEFRAPIAQGMPFIEDLTLDGGYRYSDYSTGVTADTYKVGLEWAPVSDIRFRASFNRAIRAPNIVELFNPQAVTNTSEVSVDPCAPLNGAPATATFQQCARTGVTAAQYGNGGTTNRIIQCPAGQCAVLQGGNPNLNPEKANTYTVGFTVKPRFIPGFTGSLDYYQIKLEGAISQIPLSFTLNQCLTTGDASFCSNVVRAPNGGLFGTSVLGGGYINGAAINIGEGQTEGIDVQASYSIPLNDIGLGDHGSIAASFIGSDLIKATTTPTPGAHTYDCAGLFGPTCQTVNPKWRHTLRLSWQTPWDLLLSANWRYIGSAKLETNTSDPTLGNGRTDVFDAKLPAISYLDLAAQWNVRTGFSVRAGVNNVFDKDPPLLNSLVVGTGLPNTYPTYDLLGRTMFVAFTANF